MANSKLEKVLSGVVERNPTIVHRLNLVSHAAVDEAAARLLKEEAVREVNRALNRFAYEGDE